MSKQTISITAAWLLTIGSDVIVRLEIDGAWHDVIIENKDGSYSHIIETGGIKNATAKRQ
jgi:hypothetical protein